MLISKRTLFYVFLKELLARFYVLYFMRGFPQAAIVYQQELLLEITVIVSKSTLVVFFGIVRIYYGHYLKDFSFAVFLHASIKSTT